jgi:hypothetical protein
MTSEFILVVSIVALFFILFSAYMDGLDFRKWSSWLSGVIGVLLIVFNLGLSVNSFVIAIGMVAIIWIMIIASQGFDLRKRSSWLYGAVGFLCGIALGAGITGKFSDGLGMGIIFAYIVLFTGAVIRWHKLKYGGR